MSHFKERINLFKDKSFTCFVISILFAAFGNGLTYVVTAWLVQQNDHAHIAGSVVPVTILMICFWLPGTLFGPFFGVYVDRHSRKKIILLTNLARALIWTAFGIIFYFHMTNLMIYVLTTIIGLLLSFYLPAAMTFVREIVEEDKLLYANSTIDITYEVGNVVGMGCAGLIMSLLSAQASIWINGICYLIATISVMVINKKIPIKALESKIARSVINDLIMGIKYLATNKKILSVYTLQLLIFVQLMTTPILIVPYATSVLHATVGEFGQIEASMSVGLVLGGIIIPWLAERFSFTQFVNGICLLAAAAFIWFSHNHSIPTAIVIYFILGLCFSIWSLIITYAQNSTDLDYQGRVQSAFNSLSGVMILLVYLAVNLSSELLSLQNLYYIEVVLSVLGIALATASSGMHRKLEF